MATTDGNGIVFLEETDPISPFHTMINTLQQGTSDALQAFNDASLKTLSVDVQVFTSNGTWTKPDDAVAVRVRLVGGGGGGGGALGASAGHAEGGGGGAGGYVEKWFAADDLDATEAVVIGSGGSGVTGGTGQTGGASTFSTLSANGGGGGGTATATTGAAIGVRGIGGSASGGDINVPGEPGGYGRVIGGQIVLLGTGGSSVFGAGGSARSTLGSYDASGYGSGGGGAFATTSNQAGGNGTSGICIVETIVASA